MIALDTPTTITVSVVGLVAILALFALLRVLLRSEPAPATWRRYRLGVFVERDPRDDAPAPAPAPEPEEPS